MARSLTRHPDAESVLTCSRDYSREFEEETEDEEEEEEEDDDDAPCDLLPCNFKALACWTAFAGYLILDVSIHLRFGWNEETFEKEEEGGDDRMSSSNKHMFDALVHFNAFYELFCKAFLHVMVACMLFELIYALYHRKVLRCCRTFWDCGSMNSNCHQRTTFVVSVLFSVMTTIVGLIGSFSDEDKLPLWMKVYMHAFEVLCHSTVLATLIAFVYHFVEACCTGGCHSLCKHICLCESQPDDESGLVHCLCENDDEDSKDNLLPSQTHAYSTSRTQSENRRTWRRLICVRSVFLWVVFLLGMTQVIIVTYVHQDIWKNWFDSRCLKSELAVVDVMCWASISWWLVSIFSELEFFFASKLARRDHH